MQSHIHFWQFDDTTPPAETPCQVCGMPYLQSCVERAAVVLVTGTREVAASAECDYFRCRRGKRLLARSQ